MITACALEVIRYALSFNSIGKQERNGSHGDITKKLSNFSIPSNTIVESLDVIKLLEKYSKLYKDKHVFLYLDPPYLPETRVEGARNVYAHEMEEGDHTEMLMALKRLPENFKVMLSGYDNDLYDDILGTSFKKHELKECLATSSTADVKPSRQEFVWLNYKPNDKETNDD